MAQASAPVSPSVPSQIVPEKSKIRRAPSQSFSRRRCRTSITAIQGADGTCLSAGGSASAPSTPQRGASGASSAKPAAAAVDPNLAVLLQGDRLWKHDYGRTFRSCKWVQLSANGMELRWRTVAPEPEKEAPRPSEPSSPAKQPGRIRRSLSAGFARTRKSSSQDPEPASPQPNNNTIRRTPSASFATRWSTCDLAVVQEIVYGPYSSVFQRPGTGRADPAWACLSLRMPDEMGRASIDFAVCSHEQLRPWVLGLQLAVALARQRLQLPVPYPPWSLGYFCWERARMSLVDLAQRTGRSPIQLLLNAVLLQMEADVLRTIQATRLQASWRALAARKHYKQQLKVQRAKKANFASPARSASAAPRPPAAEAGGSPRRSAGGSAAAKLAAQLAASDGLLTPAAPPRPPSPAPSEQPSETPLRI